MRTGRPRSATADAAILEAAIELFLAGGVEAASMEQIAKRAGVSKVTIYRRWSSKEDLLAQAIETSRTAVANDARIEDYDSAGDLLTGTLPAVVATILDPHMRAMTAQIYGSATTHPKLLQTYWDTYVPPRRNAFRAILERAKAEEVLDPDCDIEVLIDMIVGALQFRMLQPTPLDEAGAEEYIRCLYRQAGLV